MDLIDRDAISYKVKSCITIPADSEWDSGYNTAMAEAKQYIQNAPAVNRWIPVEDALPEQSEEGQPPNVKCSDCVLVAAVDWIGMAYYVTYGEESQWEFADAQNNPKIDFVEITHWMPLPEPPKED